MPLGLRLNPPERGLLKAMRRAYRPRLSKDKAIAQRLQDLSVARQLEAFAALEPASPSAPTGPPAPPTPAGSPALGATAAREAATRLTDDSPGLPSAPKPTPAVLRWGDGSRSSRSRSRNLYRAKTTPTTAGKRTQIPAHPAAAETSPSGAVSSSSKVRATAGTSPAASVNQGRGGKSSRRHVGVPACPEDSGGGGSGSLEEGWSCVSCSFLNLATAKKCRICGTKNFQPRLSPPAAITPAPASAAAAETAGPSKGLGDGVGRARGSAVQDTQRLRQGGIGPFERQSPRRAKQDTAGADLWSTGTGEAGSGPESGAGSRGGGCGTASRKRRRNSTPGRATTSSVAGREDGVVLPFSGDAVTAAVDGTPLRRTARWRGTGSDATVAVVSAGATPTNDRSSASDGDARKTAVAAGAVNLYQGIPSPSSPSFRNRAEKCPRAPTSTGAKAGAEAAAAEGAEAMKATPCPSPGTVTLSALTKAPCLSASISGEADPSSLRTCGCVETAWTNEDHGVRPHSQTSPRKGQPATVSSVIPPLSAEDDGREESETASSILARTSRGRGMTPTAEGAAPTRSPSATFTPLSSERESSPVAGRDHSRPVVAHLASLDFTGNPTWRVSSVVVTSAVGVCGSRSVAAAGGFTTAAITVCHAGGVSVWDLADAKAVCTHLSPVLAGASTEFFSGNFLTAAVVGGDPAEVASSATRAPGGSENYIMAIGRSKADPSFPILRVWRQRRRQLPLQLLPKKVGHVIGRNIGGAGMSSIDLAREKTASTATRAPPAVLAVTLKKKFVKFFPPSVPSHVRPCLCVCGYEPNSASDGLREGVGADGVAEGEQSAAGVQTGAAPAGQVYAVMALGGKVLRLVFGAGRSESEGFSAKTLHTGLAAEAECTSLVPVPSNPFLVCASLPSASTAVLWNVRKQELLFTLPLIASSICIPAMFSAAGDAMGTSRVSATAAANGGSDGAVSGNRAIARSGRSSPRASAATAGAAAEAAAEVAGVGAAPAAAVEAAGVGAAPAAAAEAAGVGAAPAAATTEVAEGASTAAPARRPDFRLLCLLATGNRYDCSGGHREVSSRGPTKDKRRAGCGLFGVFCGGDDNGEGTHSCGRVSAIPLEVGAGGEGPEPSLLGAGADEGDRGVTGNEQSRRKSGESATVGGSGGGDDDAAANLRCLSDGGNGFVVGVDGRGKIAARSIITGEPRELVMPGSAAEAGSKATFSTMDFDSSSGVVALATATGASRVAFATSVDLYQLRDW